MKQPRPAVLITALALAATAGLAQYVEDSVYVGGWYVGSLAYNSRADVVYGRSQSDNIFFAIDCATNQVIASWYLSWPRYLAYDSIDNKAYCTFQRSGEDSVLVVDGTTHQRLRAVGLRYANYAVWDGWANRLYVSCTDDNRVAVIDCRTDQVIGSIWPGREPVKMFLHPSRRRLYIFADGASAVNIADLTTLELVGGVWVHGSPQAGCYSEAAGKFYCGGLNDAAVIDGVGDTLLRRLMPSPQAGYYSAVWAASSNRVLLGAWSGGWQDTIFVFDAATDTLVNRLAIGRSPWGATWSGGSSTAYFGLYVDGAVVAVSGDGLRVNSVMGAGRSPFAFQPVNRHRRVYVGQLGGDWVYVIRDTSTAAIEEPAAPPASRTAAIRAVPSPFRNQVTLTASLDRVSGVIDVYSVDGRLVRSLTADATGQAVWDGRDASGRSVLAGTYIVVEKGGGGARASVVKQ